MKIAFLTFIVS